MVLPDAPPASPLPPAGSTSEFRSDPGALRALLGAVAVCTVAAMLLAVTQSASPLEFSQLQTEGSMPQWLTEPHSSSWVNDTWSLGVVLLIVSAFLSAGLWLAGSAGLRMWCGGLMTVWLTWTLAGLMAVAQAPPSGETRIVTRALEPASSLSYSELDDSERTEWLAKFFVGGVGGMLFLGILMLIPVRSLVPSLTPWVTGEVLIPVDLRPPASRVAPPPFSLRGGLVLEWANWDGWRFAMQLLILGVLLSTLLIPSIQLPIFLLSLFIGGQSHLLARLLHLNPWYVSQTLFIAYPLLTVLLCGWYAVRPSWGLAVSMSVNQIVLALAIWLQLGIVLVTATGFIQLGTGEWEISGYAAAILAGFGSAYLLEAALLAASRIRDTSAMTRARLGISEQIVDPLRDSSAAYCPECAQQVHARGGMCLYCGGSVCAI